MINKKVIIYIFIFSTIFLLVGCSSNLEQDNIARSSERVGFDEYSNYGPITDDACMEFGGLVIDEKNYSIYNNNQVELKNGKYELYSKYFKTIKRSNFYIDNSTGKVYECLSYGTKSKHSGLMFFLTWIEVGKIKQCCFNAL